MILISMRKNSKNINDEYYSRKGYKNEDIDERSGKPKRGLVSFQIEYKLWNEFDKAIEQHHGKYKKSYIIESLIRQYMESKKDSSDSYSVQY